MCFGAGSRRARGLRLVVLHCCYVLLTCDPEPHAWLAKVVIFAQTPRIVPCLICINSGVFGAMSQRVQKNSESDFSLHVYLSFLALVFLGVGSVVYGAIQPTRLANPGIAAYEAPAAVRALYPQHRTSFFEGDIVPAPVAAVEASDLEHALPTTVRPTIRSERKVGSEASEHRKSSKRTASRTRERQRQVILTHNPEYGFQRVW